MRIVHLAAGAGGMYCGACARDIGLARGLIARGHQVEIVPLYTPLRFDGGEPLPTAPVMLGGVNAYLEQSLAPWRYAPAAIRRLLDHPRVLDLVSRFAVSTRASDLGPMIVSVLRGVDGRQRRSVIEVARYVEDILRADPSSPPLVSITNSLLTGVAPELRRRLGTPIACGLQGEDAFVEATPEPHRSRAIDLMRRNARSVDVFISPSRSYAETMAAFLDVPRHKVRVAHVGVDPAPYRMPARSRPYPFTVAYLSVITAAKGVDLLVEAVISLLDAGRDLELAIAGKVLDRGYWERVVHMLEATSHADRVRYVGEVDFAGKLHLFRGCSVLCVPSRIAESRGVVAIEAQASGVPVVVPDSGVFPEMIARTSGGVTYRQGDPKELAGALGRLMDDPEGRAAMARAGSGAAACHYSADRMVDETLEAFRSVVGP